MSLELSTYVSVSAWRSFGGRPVRDTVAGCRVETKQLGANSGVFLLEASFMVVVVVIVVVVVVFSNRCRCNFKCKCVWCSNYATNTHTHSQEGHDGDERPFLLVFHFCLVFQVQADAGTKCGKVVGMIKN